MAQRLNGLKLDRRFALKKGTRRYRAWELASRTVKEFNEDECMMLASAMAYYAIFSLFPLVLGLVALLGLILDPQEVQTRLLGTIAPYFPGSADMITKNVNGVLASRGTIGVISIISLLWSSTAIFSAVGTGLNKAFNVKKPRSFIAQKLIDLAMVAGVGFLFLFSIAATGIFQLLSLLQPTQLQGSPLGPVVAIVLSLVPMAISFGMFLLIFRFVPHVNLTWGDVWPGALLAAVLFEAAKDFFAWYVAHGTNYAQVYESLGVFIAFLFWAYLSSAILLLGAEFSSVYYGLRHNITSPS